MKNYFLGFLSCLCLMCLVGLTQRSNNYVSETSVRDEFDNLFINAQGKQHIIFTSTPTTFDLQEGQIGFTNYDDTMRQVIRIGDDLYISTFTKHY